MTFQLILCLTIPLMTVLLPPKYTHSRFWLLATGCSSLLRLSLLENPLSSDIPDSLWMQRLTLFPRSMDISSVDIHWDICVQHWLCFYLPLCFCIEGFGFRGILFKLTLLFFLWSSSCLRPETFFIIVFVCVMKPKQIKWAQRPSLTTKQTKNTVLCPFSLFKAMAHQLCDGTKGWAWWWWREELDAFSLCFHV